MGVEEQRFRRTALRCVAPADSGAARCVPHCYLCWHGPIRARDASALVRRLRVLSAAALCHALAPLHAAACYPLRPLHFNPRARSFSLSLSLPLFSRSRLSAQALAVSLLAAAVGGAEAQAQLNANVCHQLTTEASCTTSKDSRGSFLNQPCTWCCGGPCTTTPGVYDSTIGCQPHDWLMARGDYSGTGKNGAGYNTCPATCSDFSGTYDDNPYWSGGQMTQVGCTLTWSCPYGGCGTTSATVSGARMEWSDQSASGTLSGDVITWADGNSWERRPGTAAGCSGTEVLDLPYSNHAYSSVIYGDCKYTSTPHHT